MKKLLPASQNLKGFTLIELMISIAVIGILSTIGLATYRSTLITNRDARRIADAKQIQTALELYYNKYGFYPQSANCNGTVPNIYWCNSVESGNGLAWLRNGYAQTLLEFYPRDPIDPINSLNTSGNWPTGANYAYYYFAGWYGDVSPSSHWYMLVYKLEKPNPDLEKDDGVVAPDGTCFDYGWPWPAPCPLSNVPEGNGIITVGMDKQRLDR